jgi:hypothetical protein
MQKYGIIAVLLLIVGSAVLIHPAHAENEPNDTPAQAIPIEIGYDNGEVGATLTQDDEDYYSFEAVAERTYVIETYNIDGTDDDATGLWLYNAAGTELDNDQYGDRGTGNANARIIFTPVTDGTYFILVREHERLGSWVGTYSVRVLPRYDQPGAGWDAENDNEPNDTRATANEIEIGLSGGQTHQLFNNENIVSDGRDHDYYRFEAMAERTYVIETYNIDGTDDDATGLWLYNAAGTELDNDQYGDRGTGNVNARLIFTPVTDGTYFVLVKKHERLGSWVGTYSIRVLPRYGEPGVDRQPGSEPDDVIPLANLLELGPAQAQTQQISAYDNVVSDAPDQDFYRFDAVAGRSYRIQTFNVQENSDGDGTGLWLYNEGGAELANDEYGRNGEGNVDAQITFTFTNSGTYFVRVRQFRSSIGETWTGAYSVRACAGSCREHVYLPLVRR